MSKIKSSLLLASSLLVAFCGLSTAQAAVDADAAQALLKKSACLTCHAIDKKKVAASYKDVAKKYKDKADAEDKLVKHLTSKPMVEMEGTKMEHMAIKSNDSAEIRNVVQWILSR